MTTPLTLDYNTETDTPKPELPYFKGQEWTVFEHIPPKPPKSIICPLEEGANDERQRVDVLTRCVKHPPLPGQLGLQDARLRILAMIRVGDRKFSQVVLVRAVSGRLCSTNLVAKFYDPLYCDHEQDDVDPFQCVDVNYTCESAAYRYLSALEERNIPSFYGSYSLEMAVPPSSSRLIRLILLEHIHGVMMNKLDPQKLSQAYRMAIMKQIVNAETRFYWKDVVHNDIYRRNIIIQGPGEQDLSKVHIVFVDFGNAQIGRLCEAVVCGEDCFLPGTYISPILRWDRDNLHPLTDDFEDWIDWDWNNWLREEYSQDIEGITPYMESVFLDPKKPVPERLKIKADL